jgi:predicted esterase
MEIKTHHIVTSKTARYTAYGELSSKTKYFWFVLHGSNMLSEQMLYKFKDFDPETHFVIAPEGLSRFYVNGFGGEVVASWMTKRDRLEEIHDFSVYCSTLYDTYVQKLPESCKTIIMGFSQGGVMAMRWLHHLDVTVDFLIPYACWIPEDIDYLTAKTDWNKICKIFT